MILIIRNTNYLGGLYYLLRFARNYKELIKDKILIITFDENIPKELINSKFELINLQLPRFVIKISSILGKLIGFSFLEFILMLKLKQKTSFASNVFLPRPIRKLFGLKIIEWWPDFQLFDLPENFSKLNRLSRLAYYYRIKWHSDRIIVQSELDKTRINSKKAHVWSFYEDVSKIKVTGNLNLAFDKYFFCAQQGWKHKRIDKLIDFFRSNTHLNLVLCGDMKDSKDKTYSTLLTQKLKNLPVNIKFLGKVKYDDMINLMKNSSGVINLSLYEGWNTQVEEAISIDIPLILSEIEIFKIQAPHASFVSEKNLDQSLKTILEEKLLNDQNKRISKMNYVQRVGKSQKQFLDAFKI